MKRATAKKVSKLMLRIGADLDKSLQEVQQKESAAEFKRYREAVSKLLLITLTDVMYPLYLEHPDLKPDELRMK